MNQNQHSSSPPFVLYVTLQQIVLMLMPGRVMWEELPRLWEKLILETGSDRTAEMT